MKTGHVIRYITSVLSLGFALGCSSVAEAQQTATVNVAGTAGPWSYANGGLNTNYQYGVADNTAATVVSAANGFSFSQGSLFTIQYLNGLVSAGGSSFPSTDANGDTGYQTNGNTGSSGEYFPSRFSSAASYPTYLCELFGTFTDSSGAIVGTPFAVGDLLTVAAPAGATRLQLGVNDDIFSDNSGSFNIKVSGASAPEPSCVLIAGPGLLVVGIPRRRRIAPHAEAPVKA